MNIPLLCGYRCLLDIVSGGSKGGARDARPPGGPNSFNFMQFLEKLAKSYVGAPPQGLAPQPLGNPGSATDCGLRKTASVMCDFKKYTKHCSLQTYYYC